MKKLTKTKLFLDGGDPAETAEATRLLNGAGYEGLNGQTTNPSLVAKNPDIAARIQQGSKLTSEELLRKYKEIVQEIEGNAPGAISIEVYADENTTVEEIVVQAREMTAWIDSAVIKLPIIKAGLNAAEILKDEMRLNMTLCFSQPQAAAVYAATAGSKHPVLLSPFIGRLDDKGVDGMQLVANILRMYKEGDGHVEVLVASVRSIDHVLGALALSAPAMTMPFDKAFQPWAEAGFPLPDDNYEYKFKGENVLYEKLDLSGDWRDFDIQHELTDAGLRKFVGDWNALLVD